MVTLTAVGGEDRPPSLQQRQQEAKAALQAAREAIDVADRRLDTMTKNLESVAIVHKGYQKDEYERAAQYARRSAMDELTESVKHLADAVQIWWPHLSVSWLLYDGSDPAA